MLKRLHAVAGAIGLVTIVVFWTSTAISELFGAPADVVAVKQAILWGFLVLIPALATAGATGMRLGRRRHGALVAAKRRRMPWIAGNGILVLVPAAIYLAGSAAAGRLDTWFYAVQAVEMVAGAINITLLALSLCDGLRLGGWLPRSDAAAPL